MLVEMSEMYHSMLVLQISIDECKVPLLWCSCSRWANKLPN